MIKRELEKYLIMKVKGKTVAVVGNATFNNNLGEEIDRHSEVIRFNDYKINGHEEKVGKKTTIWCNRASNHANIYNHGICINPRWVAEEDYKIKIETLEPEIDYHEKLRCEYDNSNTVSTGVLLLYILNELRIPCDVYGFDFLSSDHYYSDKKPDTKTHNVNYEKKLFKKMSFMCYRGC